MSRLTGGAFEVGTGSWQVTFYPLLTLIFKLNWVSQVELLEAARE